MASSAPVISKEDLVIQVFEAEGVMLKHWILRYEHICLHVQQANKRMSSEQNIYKYRARALHQVKHIDVAEIKHITTIYR